MLQRFKSIIADQMPIKRDNIVLCQLAPEQVRVIHYIQYIHIYLWDPGTNYSIYTHTSVLGLTLTLTLNPRYV